MTDVFISYSRSERSRAEPVRDGLTELGLEIFFDLDDIDGGDAFPDVIDKAVKESGAIVGCWTPLALTRPWVKSECQIANERKTLIPVELDKLSALDVPAAFFSLHRIDLADFDGRRDHEGWLQLARALARRLGRPAIQDRAALLAEVAPRFKPSRVLSAPECATLWDAWYRLGSSSDMAALEAFLQQVQGTIFQPVGERRLQALAAPDVGAPVGVAAGALPPRGGDRARMLAVRAGAAVVAMGALAVAYTTLVAPQIEEVKAVRQRAEAAEARSVRLEQELAAARSTTSETRSASLSSTASAPPASSAGAAMPGRQLVTAQQLRALSSSAFGGLDAKQVAAINAALQDFGIDTPLRKAHFFAQAMYESNGFKTLVENLNYPASRLVKVYPTYFPDLEMAQAYGNNPQKIGNRIYAGRIGNGDEASGDGYRFRGRGVLQSVGRSTYKRIGDLVGVDLIKEPDLLASDIVLSIRGAAAVWKSARANEPADADNVEQVTKRIAGGFANLRGRIDALAITKATFGAR